MLGPTNTSQRSRTYYVPVIALNILRMTSLFHLQVEKQTLIYSSSQASEESLLCFYVCRSLTEVSSKRRTLNIATVADTLAQLYKYMFFLCQDYS